MEGKKFGNARYSQEFAEHFHRGRAFRNQLPKAQPQLPQRFSSSTCHVPSSRDAIDPDNTLYSVIVLIQVLPVYDKQHSFRGIHICMALMQGWAHGNRD